MSPAPSLGVRKRWRLGLTVSAATTVASLLLLEGLLRVAIFADQPFIPQLRRASLYADPWSDDVFWKLDYLFSASAPRDAAGSTASDAGRMELHEILGWVPRRTEENPLGIVTNQAYDLEALTAPVLFFGDSYVDGPEPIPNKIPQQLDSLIPDRPVLNYGVSGYGLDQIYLRFSMEAPRYENPMVLIGIQDRDIDRSILSIRNGQKPRLEIQAGSLVVRNTPIVSADEYVRLNPPVVRSYLWRFVVFRLRPLIPNSWVDALFGYDEVHRVKLALNRLILAEMKREAEDMGISLYVVLFYVKQDMLTENWRESFLKTSLEEIGITYFDTKAYLLDELTGTAETVDDVWSIAHGHLNARGNAIVAQGLAQWLNEQDPAVNL